MLSKLIALAAVIALSPITIVPAVLVLHAPRPRPVSLAFLGGWLLGLIALTAAFVTGSDLLSGIHTTPPKWASWVRLGFGVALLALAAYHWFTRHRRRTMPRWMRSFSTLSPLRAAVMGAVLVPLRPEVLILCAAAGLAVGNSSLSAGAQLVAAAIFVVLAASTVAIPIVAYVGAGDRLDDALERVKAWMEANHDAMMAVILFLIGLIVLYNGIRTLV
ncbi:GAP family protein [Mycobacterium sp. 94-17]|uniref:GAP family protein n=1 Tax=Mycobacterium sp. 94-17 TaxID=2986147 RepID=UPI002D1EAA8C|nr:GAP family protein [Mycobacterium sp. 94-17]MEB4208405.1 GAP family protein [Mycobacterium sp. 94-17]